MNKLIIVESPTKVHTIKKILGSGYEVIASNGHIRDLPKSRMGVDIEHDFEPRYITIRGKGELMSALKKEIKKADRIYLATDPDREGEAISWHLREGLDMSGRDVRRITFNEITKSAVKAAIKSPRDIDMNLVNAQQARRVLDRVVGYQLSPVLWKKVKSKLSAGRVQSAVLRMVNDREAEINAFVPQEYWTVAAKLRTEAGKFFTAEYYGKGEKKLTPGSLEEAEKVESEIREAPFTVSERKESRRQKNAPYPFTTSTLQQEASNRLNFSTQKTMRVAQELYEGVSVKGFGTVGLITYLRTDSTRVADEADRACKALVAEKYGKEYVGQGAVKPGRNNVQDAHEAIRPSDLAISPDTVKTSLSRDAYRLYKLIYERFVASRMKAAVYDTVSIKLSAAGHVFTCASSKVSFKGYLAAYAWDEEKSTPDNVVAALQEGDRASLSELMKEQHFTQPPAHYTEASLVRAMEENGLGRPSTYAPTITNILGRHYIAKEGRSIVMTELGETVNGIMEHSFPDIVDPGFTAHMEEELDRVETGEKDWHLVMKDFYPNFEKEVEKAEKELEHVTVEDEVSDVICELCGRNMVIKYGRNGKFLACPGFPECRNTKSIVEYADAVCPDCGGRIILRRTRKGRRYFACENESCGFMSWTRPKNA